MRSVVLLSGGLDSAVCAALEQERGAEVYPLFVWYGQRHAEQERRAMTRISRHLGCWGRTRFVNLPELGGSSLTGSGALRGASVVVPDRNLILCGVASNHAQHLGAECIVLGANATDHGGFYDCRPEFFERLKLTLSARIHLPLIQRTKVEIVAEARRLGVPIELTWSCYAGGVEPCGECGACVERERALNTADQDTCAYAEVAP